MSKTYAQFETRTAALSTEFGLEWATKLFGAEAIASLPVLKAGPNKGKPKGFVIWQKTTVAGYSREYSTPFAMGQLARAWIGAGQFSTRSEALEGQWMGRTQGLSGPPDYMFEEGRARYAAEQARNDADRAEEIAEWRAEQAAKAAQGGSLCRNSIG